jgi:hypothetical protein
VTDTVDDTGLLDKHGRIRSGRNDFAAKLGLLIWDEAAREVRELAYVWTRQLPEDTLFYQETVIIRFILKFKLYRIVAESGPTNVGRWTPERRDLAADFARVYPKGRPGALVRVYVMTDTNGAGTRLESGFADLAFHREPPGAREIAREAD